MITPHTTSDFDKIVQKMILKSEGENISVPHNIGDNTLTYGYGFTFIRKKKDVWNIYENLDDDLFEIGIVLNEEEEKMLDNIVKALNSKDKNKDKTVKSLLQKFEETWKETRKDSNGNPLLLSDPDAQTLYETEIEHKTEIILERFKSVLGNTNGQTLYDNLQGTREMVSLLSLAYLAETLIGRKLTKAMWEGNRAEAWFEIRYGWADKDPKFNKGWAKRHYLEAQMFGLYEEDNPNNVTLTEAQQIFKMLEKNRLEIARREALYGKAFDGTEGTELIEGRNLTPLEAAKEDYKGLLQYVEKPAGQEATIQDLLSAFEPAKGKLLDDLRVRYPEIADKLSNDSFVSTNIYLNPHKSTDENQLSVLDSKEELGSGLD